MRTTKLRGSAAKALEKRVGDEGVYVHNGVEGLQVD